MKPWRRTRHVRRARALDGSAGGAEYTALASLGEGIRLLAKSLAKTWGADGITAHSITLDPHAFLAARMQPVSQPTTPSTIRPSAGPR